MKKRTINYLKRQQAIRDMINFRDIKSFLMAGFKISNSHVVQKDILQTLFELKHSGLSVAKAS